MSIKTRLDLSSKVAVSKAVSECRPQVQLYTEKLLGRQGCARTEVSKFKAKMQALFPVRFQNQSLEFRDVEVVESSATDVASDASGWAAGGVTSNGGFEASIKLEWFCYGKIFGILYIQQRMSISVPLVKFPKLSATDMLSVNGVEKVLVSQLGRQPGLRIEADENSINISFLKDNATMFQIRADRETCCALCGGHEVELLRTLMALGVTKYNIIGVLHDVRTVVYTNGEWCELSFRGFADEGSAGAFGEAYGWRRNTRFGEDIASVGILKNAVVVEDVVGFDKRVTLRAGERMIWDVERLECGCVKVADAAAAATIALLNSVRGTEVAGFEASLVASRIGLVDLELAGRSALNAITKRADGAMLSCVTKRDLILI